MSSGVLCWRRPMPSWQAPTRLWQGGQTGDALVDFTGGVNEAINIGEGGYENDEDKKTELFEKMVEAQKHKAMISCSIALSEGDAPEKQLDCGLIKGHAYAITDIRKMSLSSGLMSILGRRSGNLMMLKLRNPWGKKEWNGAWSDQSEEWKKVPAKEREKMNIKIDDDGDFWMELHDWVHWFTDVSLCRQVNTSLLSLQKNWHEGTFHGEWKGRSAGGSVNNRETFLHNPQYVFKVPHGEAEVMLSLMQEDPRSALSSVGGKNFAIGFYIMKVEENREYRLHVIQEKVGTVTFTNRRSVFGLFSLNHGTYVVVPSTFEPHQERSFLLRIFSERSHHAKELKLEAPERGVMGVLCCCLWRRPRALVTVHLENAHDLKKQDMTGAGADPYCIVKCGGQKAETPVI
ncbi:Calpain-5, partial [Geodia barretti]